MAKIELSGFAELEEALHALGPKVARKIGAKALKAGGEIIADTARVLVPVHTGKLQDSITVVAAPKSDDEVGGAIGFRKGKPSMARRAMFIEYGTSKMAAQPFMRPALDARGEAAIAVIGKALWDGIATEAEKAKKGP